MANNKVPRELTRQVTIVEGVIKSLSDFTSTDKIQMQYYSEEFLEALVGLQKDAMELRGKLEVFKNNMERAATYSFFESARFASSENVLEGFLSGPNDD